MDLNQIVRGVTLTKACSIRPDGESEERKNVTLSVKFDGVTLSDVFAKALAQTVIQWQNGPGRKNFDNWKNGQTVQVSFKAPGQTQVDPEAAIIAKAASMSREERLAYIQSLVEKAAIS